MPEVHIYFPLIAKFHLIVTMWRENPWLVPCGDSCTKFNLHNDWSVSNERVKRTLGSVIVWCHKSQPLPLKAEGNHQKFVRKMIHRISSWNFSSSHSWRHESDLQTKSGVDGITIAVGVRCFSLKSSVTAWDGKSLRWTSYFKNRLTSKMLNVVYTSSGCALRRMNQPPAGFCTHMYMIYAALNFINQKVFFEVHYAICGIASNANGKSFFLKSSRL